MVKVLPNRTIDHDARNRDVFSGARRCGRRTPDFRNAGSLLSVDLCRLSDCRKPARSGHVRVGGNWSDSIQFARSILGLVAS